MNLQAKLTLGAVLLETLIVGAISAVDLDNAMQIEFEAARKRAEMVSIMASDYVAQALNSRTSANASDREKLRDPELSKRLNKLMTESEGLIEISVVDAHNEIWADSDPTRLGLTETKYREFSELVANQTWWQKVDLLASKKNSFYQMEQPLGPAGGGEPLVTVRVVVDAALIHVWSALTETAQAALLSFAGAVGLTFLFSALAFRRLGQLGHMLDLVASGEYAPDSGSGEGQGKDELAVMASKVNILSERLRGAQFEVSGLRGNIDRLLQDLEDAVFIFDRELRLVFASGSVEKFLGTDRAVFTGKSLPDIFPPNTTLGLLIAQAAQTGRPIRNRRAPVTAAGQTAAAVVVLLSVDMLETLPGGATGSGVLVRLRDPEAQRKLGRELQTADRLAAISRISAGVAHEVKNPLNAILLHVEVAKAKLSRGDTDVIPQMEIISREILRLDRVVKTFLDFTRPVELKLTTVPVQTLVDEIVQLARPQAEALKIRVLVAQEADGVEVRVDSDLLKQAMLNVAVNAMQAMPDGGELRFESAAFEDSAEIRISDSGAGIPPQLREKIFTLYFTTKKEGSGIGLAMTFRIVQLHDGTIDFTSEPGKGTTFSIRLPIAL
jgi:signal transduction histidine kinase